MARMLTEALKTIEHYKTTTPHYEELLDILGEILILREEWRRTIAADVFLVNEALIQTKMEGGLPLVDFSGQSYDLSEPRKYFMKLLEIGMMRLPAEAADIIRQIDDGAIDYDRLIYDSFFVSDDDEVSDVNLDDEAFDLLDLFVEESLRPFLEVTAEKYGNVITKYDWSEGYCPVCGKEPKIGELKEEEEGKRYLFCNQCGFEWKFRRIKCPFCGNEEQQTLAYFTVEEDERYRVDVCNECNRYIKIVDFRETGRAANLDVEDIATLHLDMLASEEGYH